MPMYIKEERSHELFQVIIQTIREPKDTELMKQFEGDPQHIHLVTHVNYSMRHLTTTRINQVIFGDMCR